MESKICSKCGVEKNTTEYYTESRSNGAVYVRAICKECHKTRVRAYEKNNRSVINARKREPDSTYQKWRREYSHVNQNRIYDQNKKWRQTPNGIWCSIQSRAKKYNIPLDIKRADFINWYTNVEKVCVYCGIDEDSNKSYRGHNSYRLTIDRMDSNAGYKMSNIVLACAVCNTTKSNVLTYEQMLIVGKMVKENREKNLILPSYMNGKESKAFPSDLGGCYDSAEMGVQ